MTAREPCPRPECLDAREEVYRLRELLALFGIVETDPDDVARIRRETQERARAQERREPRAPRGSCAFCRVGTDGTTALCEVCCAPTLGWRGRPRPPRSVARRWSDR